MEAPCVGLDRHADFEEAIPHVEEQLREHLGCVKMCKVTWFVSGLEFGVWGLGFRG